MNFQTRSSGLFLVLLFLAGSVVAAPYVREASFHRVFGGKDFYGQGKDLPINLSVMSSDGSVVAFYGWNGHSEDKPHLFIHDFDSTAAPVDVTLPDRLKNIDTFPGMVSNRDGTRIFFVGFDKNTGDDLFYMLNGKTGAISLALDTTGTSIENPNDIGTDGNGDYFYFNESDSGYKNEGDLWRVSASGGAPELVIQAAAVNHPTKGFGCFIGEFDVSDDGNTIAFILDGWQTDAINDWSTTDKEIFVLSGGAIKNLTHDFQNGKSTLRLSGDGSTIVYTGRDVDGTKPSIAGGSDWMVTHSSSNLNEQYYIEPGYYSRGCRPGITTDGAVIFGGSNPNGVSSPDGYLIHTDGSDRMKMDTREIIADCTTEGLHISGDGNRVFFKARPNVGTIGYVTSLYTGAFDSNPWPTLVPSVASVNYPAPLAFGIANPDDFPPFKVNIGVSDPQGVADIDNVVKTMLRFNGYPDKGGYGPIRVDTIYDSDETSPGLWETDGYHGYQWPVPPTDPVYYKDPLEIEIARFSLKDVDGNVAYRDVVLQAAEGGCSGSGVKTLDPADLGKNKDVSCIADGKVETSGSVVISADIFLYLSAPEVYLNPNFSVHEGGQVQVK